MSDAYNVQLILEGLAQSRSPCEAVAEPTCVRRARCLRRSVRPQLGSFQIGDCGVAFGLMLPDVASLK